MHEDVLTAEGEKFFRELEKLERKTVTCGVMDDAKEANGEYVSDVAIRNEFGTSTIPARPFMRNAFDNHLPEIMEITQKACQKSDKFDVDEILSEIGAGIVEIIRDEIENGSFAENAPSTIEKKGFDNPLVDTGVLKDSISFNIIEVN